MGEYKIMKIKDSYKRKHRTEGCASANGELAAANSSTSILRAKKEARSRRPEALIQFCDPMMIFNRSFPTYTSTHPHLS